MAACTSPPPLPLQPPPRVPHASPCGAPRASAPRHDPAHDPRWAPARETDDSDVDADSDVADERELRVPRVAVGYSTVTLQAKWYNVTHPTVEHDFYINVARSNSHA